MVLSILRPEPLVKSQWYLLYYKVVRFGMFHVVNECVTDQLSRSTVYY